MPERSQYHRTGIDQPAQVCVGKRHIDCRLVDISANGAGIEVVEPRSVPSRFQLKTEHDRVVFDCRIVWIKQNRIGLIFE